MYPWLWVWSPQVHFPWSGNVAQKIEPRTWFNAMIPPVSGDAEIEAQVFNAASYGTQLGLIIDILLDIVKETEDLSPKASASLKELSVLKSKIEDIKKRSGTPSRIN
ncbi:hypothetical protein H8L32_17825 [Undibacterium sp. CY18W]|uniref:Uncharacterized protein n=1 Tax=Undibacterium hunanense TaxID=2762292 RepID=A0ABR6ZU16_9BURK|nr:hypothetical protein [Undibacterium hunanense]MBC3919354.1 hypothetical protein [Undibacterium hunanense]